MNRTTKQPLNFLFRGAGLVFSPTRPTCLDRFIGRDLAMRAKKSKRGSTLGKTTPLNSREASAYMFVLCLEWVGRGRTFASNQLQAQNSPLSESDECEFCA